MAYPKHLLKVITLFKKLPGVGTRTAERFAFHLLNWNATQRKEYAEAIACIEELIGICSNCHCLCDKVQCLFCHDERLKASSICVVADAKDACTIDMTGTFKGGYHNLGGLLSPVEGIDEESLRIPQLLHRIQNEEIKEVILALDATIEGDATALYLKERLAPFSIKVSRLAFGLPMGHAFDFIDGSTLARALEGRHSF